MLVSVYVNEKPERLNQAFLSIWDQQKFKPTQIVLVKDGLLSAELDAEIKLWEAKLANILTIVDLPENVGLGAALNAGLKACNYELIARMDTDDISLPIRFDKQVAFMQARPDVAASSAALEEWDEGLTNRIGKRALPVDPDHLERFAKRRSPLSHPVSIFRKSAVLRVGGYPPLRKAQDYGLWCLLLVNGYKLANLSDTLLKMRTGNDMYARRGFEFLKHELVLLKFQKSIGFLANFDFLLNCAVKTILRLSPIFLKKLAYRFLR